jgi:ATP-binding cassette subfamily D (ALD) protein 2
MGPKRNVVGRVVSFAPLSPVDVLSFLYLIIRLGLYTYCCLRSKVVHLYTANPKRGMWVIIGLIFLHSRLKGSGSSSSGKGKKSTKPKAEVNKEFWDNLSRLLKIGFPSWTSSSSILLGVHTLFLIARTFLSIYVATMDGQIVKSIVEKDSRRFLINMMRWIVLAVPASYCNSMIRFLEAKLGIALRTKLASHMYKQYMADETYYRVENLDSRLNNADQSLTQDVQYFCDLIARLHGQISKPVFDIILMSFQMIKLASSQKKSNSKSTFGFETAFGVGLTTVYITAQVLKYFSPAFGKLVAEEAQYEGELRSAHARLITSSEEIAFYGGHKVEESFLWKCYLTLVKHMNKVFKVRIFYTALESFLMKYIWSAAGMLMVALPMMTRTFVSEGSVPGSSSVSGETASDRTQDFITQKSLLISLADASERIMSSFKEVTELAGYTQRVANMVQVFDDMKKQNYQKNLSSAATVELMRSRGQVIDGDAIEFKNVPIVSPTGDILVESLSFRLEPGMHTLITGPNGCGKSSLFRILAGIWPIYGGSLCKPFRGNLFYIPQRPYLCHGSLRDQVLYPHTVADMKAKGVCDADLDKIMAAVDLAYVVVREKGWDMSANWADILSGGEKQRLAMARLFYHRPKYAILDECTSAVSEDVEGKMYTHAKSIGITLLTVTHRHTLWKYHDHLLQFDGEGGWKFTELNVSARMSLKEEKAKIEFSLIEGDLNM